MSNEQQLFDFINAVLTTQTAILLGMVDAKVVEPKPMRDFLRL